MATGRHRGRAFPALPRAHDHLEVGGRSRSSHATSNGRANTGRCLRHWGRGSLAATKVRPGQVTGLDLNSGMLAIARSLPNDDAPINWTEGSALEMPFPSGHFDVVLCQQGLQFFPDQPRALRELHRVLRGGGRAALSVYSPLERTPGANAFVQALDQVLGPEASRIKRGEHSFAIGQLESLLRDAGFGTVGVTTVQQTIVFPSVLDYLRFQLVATPMTMLLKDKTEPERQSIISSVASTAATFRRPPCSRAASSRFRRRPTSLLRRLSDDVVDAPAVTASDVRNSAP